MSVEAENFWVASYMKQKMVTILLVEDDRFIRKLLTYGLKAQGFEVLVAENGRQGIQFLETINPELIILDLFMPEMDGLAFLKQIQDKTAVPIIVLSGSKDPKHQAEALRLGAVKFITKPIGMQPLLDIINPILAKEGSTP